MISAEGAAAPVPQDALFDIAYKAHGHANRWVEIYNANTNIIANPETIYPGQVLGVLGVKWWQTEGKRTRKQEDNASSCQSGRFGPGFGKHRRVAALRQKAVKIAIMGDLVVHSPLPCSHITGCKHVGEKTLERTRRIAMTAIRMTWFLIVAAALLALPGVAAAQSTAVTGTVTYRERLALPANAAVTVALIDISKADAAATVLAQQSFTADGRQVPFQFNLPYDPAKLSQTGVYAVQASIKVNNQPRFINLQPTLVITQGRPTSVNLVLSAAGGTLPNTAGSGTLLLIVIGMLVVLMVVRMLRVQLAGGPKMMR